VSAESAERVRVEVRDAIAYVTLARAEKYNGLDAPLFTGLVDAAKRVGEDLSVRAVILRGEGKAFSTGLDFKAFGQAPELLQRGFVDLDGRTTNLFQEAAWCWRRLPMPVVAVLHGRCYGGAMQIALAADFRFATPDCELSIMEVKWGLIPDMTGTVTLRELVGIDRAKELTMTGRVFSGAEAKAMNLITGIAADPLAAAEALAAQIKTRSPDAVAAAKALFHATWNASEAEALAAERRVQAVLLASAGHREAIRANFEKREPVFGPRRSG
jgi:enoyl-CoA hydratase/carnithine racemase